jgi:hypothetical protein
MATQVRPPRTRNSGGRTLMLLGVVLALAAGIIVIYVVSTAVGPATHTMTVVVANQNLTANTILSSGTTDATHTLISTAFTTKQVNSDFVPQDAYPFTNQNQLNIDLNDKVVIGQFFAGDILRKDDPRLIALGNAAVGSLTNLNPAELPKGSVIFPFTTDKPIGLVAGDHVDLLVTACIVGSAAQSSCPTTQDETQTTLQNLYVYAVTKDNIYLVLTHEQALEVKFLLEHTKITMVLRKPGDDATTPTTIVDGPYIVNKYFRP